MERQGTAGYRVFIFTSEKVTRISRKVFDRFYFGNKPTLKAYANQTINVAMVIYILKNRKPDQIVTIDTLRIVVNEDGMLDSKFLDRCNRFIGYKLSPPRHSFPAIAENKATSQNVIDAALIFDQKGWDTLKPKLPGPIHKQILNALFS